VSICYSQKLETILTAVSGRVEREQVENQRHHSRLQCRAVYCQGYRELIIVVDDGSTDGAAEVAESFLSPIRVICLLENMGLPTARNRRARAITGGDLRAWGLRK
jgi:GT2 family glycosyltransferase